MSPEQRVALEQALHGSLDAAAAALEDARNWARALGDDALVAVLGGASEAVVEASEGVEGWTACESCGALVIPIVHGTAALECDECGV